MTEVWIVLEDSHYIDDAWSSVDRVFNSQQKAEAYAEEMNDQIPKREPVEFVVERRRVF